MDSSAIAYQYYTAEEYYQATADYDRRTELRDGLIVDMASPNIRHQTISDGIVSEMRDFVRKNRGKCRPISGVDVKLDNSNIVVPDIMVACDPDRFDKQKYNGAPDFVAEIVSTNRIDDYVRKLTLYYRSGVREYWIIDPAKEKVTVYCFDKDDTPTEYDFHTPIPVGIWDGKLTVTISEMENL